MKGLSYCVPDSERREGIASCDRDGISLFKWHG